MLRNTSKDTNFGKADCKLSDMASQLLQINKAEYESYEDMHAFHAPLECGNIIARSYNNLRERLFAEYEITEDEFFDEIQCRTSSKWLYFSSGLIFSK